MRDNRTEILLEENFRYENMTIEERNFIMTFLYSTKELSDNTNLKIVTCNFKRIKDNSYKANGAMSSDDKQASWFDSYIDIDENKLSIRLDITKLCSDKNDTPKDYKEYSIFTKTYDKVYRRKTTYSYSSVQFEDDIVINNYDSIYDDSNFVIKK